jgi:hypothetical protein
MTIDRADPGRMTHRRFVTGTPAGGAAAGVTGAKDSAVGTFPTYDKGLNLYYADGDQL